MAYAHIERTAHGSTLVFGTTTTFAVHILSISGFEVDRGELDKTHLGSGAYREYVPGDIIDAGEFTIDFFYDTNVRPPFTAAPETITINIPHSTTGSVSSANPKMSGTGFVKKFSTPELVSGTLMRAQAVIRWSTGPTFTAET